MASTRKPPPAEPPAAVAAFLERHRIRGRQVCVGLSGGLDSVVLVHALARVAGDYELRLSACHVNHGLSPNAESWQLHCEGLCAGLGIELEVRRVHPVASGEGLEAAARRARLAALAGVGADWVALAHHRDDQAETLLFRLFRGAGVRGAGAMAELERRRDGLSLIRPLLGLGRAGIERWAREGGLEWVEDESNERSDFDRNFIRHRLLAPARSRFPAVGERLAGAAARFREAQGLLDQLAAEDWQRWADRGLLARATVDRLDPARLRNLLRWRMHQLGLGLPDEARLHEALRQLAAVGPAHPLRIPLAEGELCHFRGRCWIQPALAEAPSGVMPWTGEPRLAWAGGELCFERCTGDGVAARLFGRAPLIAARSGGERLRPRAGGPARTVKNLAQECGVPPWVRARLPLLRSGDRILWVAELGVDAAARCGPGEAGWRVRWQPPPGVLSCLPGDCADR